VVYLTTQDLLWINAEVNKKPSPFHVMDLEETVGHQYGYLKVEDVLEAAARFLAAFLRLRPFTEANDRTALCATLALLRHNGYEVRLTDPDAWLARVKSGEVPPIDAIREALGERGPAPPFAAAFRDLLATYGRPHS
jgi:prophage maintenance system killer protein